MRVVSGGVCAAKGYTANGIHCGIRKNHSKKDLALIFSAVPASAAAVYTTNLVKGAPLTVTKKHLENGIAQAVICNSGNANTCNANGIEIAELMSELTAKELGIAANDVIVASTGVIGQPLNITPIEAGMNELVAGLSENGGEAAALAIPNLYLAKKISWVLGAVFSVFLVLGIFSSCSAMMWIVCQKFSFKDAKKDRWVAVALAIGTFLMGLISFGDLIATLYPFIGYCGLIYMVGVVWKKVKK